MSKTTVPKYSFEILVVIGVLVLANIVLSILGEHRLWAYSYTLFIVITTIQLLRLMRARMQILHEIAEHQKGKPTLHEPQHITDDDLKDLREEIERHKVARAES